MSDICVKCCHNYHVGPWLVATARHAIWPLTTEAESVHTRLNVWGKFEEIPSRGFLREIIGSQGWDGQTAHPKPRLGPLRSLVQRHKNSDETAHDKVCSLSWVTAPWFLRDKETLLLYLKQKMLSFSNIFFDAKSSKVPSTIIERRQTSLLQPTPQKWMDELLCRWEENVSLTFDIPLNSSVFRR